MPLPPLGISATDFAGLADRVGREAAAHLRNLDSAPIRPATTGAESLALFAGPAPERGLGAAALDVLGEVAQAQPGRQWALLRLRDGLG